jgi:hypothetical protein
MTKVTFARTEVKADAQGIWCGAAIRVPCPVKIARHRQTYSVKPT